MRCQQQQHEDPHQRKLVDHGCPGVGVHGAVEQQHIAQHWIVGEPAAHKELQRPETAHEGESARAAAGQQRNTGAEGEHGQAGRGPDQLAGEQAAQRGTDRPRPGDA